MKNMKLKQYHRLLMLLLGCLGFHACGDSVFSSLEEKDPLTQATRELEKGNSDSAIRILLDALGSEVEDIVVNQSGSELSANLYAAVSGRASYTKYVSVLSAGYAQKAGLDPLDLVLKMAEDQSQASGEGAEAEGAEAEGGDESKKNVTGLFPALPPATAGNIDIVDRALAILLAIPSESRTNGDLLKLSLLLTGSFALKLKALDLDGDGNISAEEALAVTQDSAEGIIGTLGQSIITMTQFSDANTEHSASKKSKEKLETILIKINSMEGEDDAERLSNYLGQESGAAS